MHHVRLLHKSTIHRTDCINIINMPKEERIRLIDAEWNVPKNESSQTNNYIVEINIYANNHKGVLLGIIFSASAPGSTITTFPLETF